MLENENDNLRMPGSDTAGAVGSLPEPYSKVLHMMQKVDPLMSTPSEEPAWKQRAVERSTRAAKLRAEQRVQRFLDAAQTIITEKGNTDFTVQEVVDRSRQSLRSFYQHFDGKHELLLALLEDALRRATDQIRAAASGQSAPLDRLKVAVETPATTHELSVGKLQAWLECSGKTPREQATKATLRELIG